MRSLVEAALLDQEQRILAMTPEQLQVAYVRRYRRLPHLCEGGCPVTLSRFRFCKVCRKTLRSAQP